MANLTFDEVQALPVVQHPEWPSHMIRTNPKEVDPDDQDDDDPDNHVYMNMDLGDDDDDDDDDKPPKKSLQKKKKRKAPSGHTGRLSLGLNVAQCRNMPVGTDEHLRVACRETFQNLWDQSGIRNGGKQPSLNNLHFVRGFRNKGKEEVICLHNGVVRLAEIIHIVEPKKGPIFFADVKSLQGDERPPVSTLSFVNYGTVLSSVTQVLSIGDSGKSNKINQVGMHGEGLKTAILRFLHCGIGVTIQCCVLGVASVPVTQRWRFYISSDSKNKNVLCTNITKAAMKELVEKAKDIARFELILTYTRKSYLSPLRPDPIRPPPLWLNFSIDSYLIDRQYVRNQIGPSDIGSYVATGERGTIWCSHFYIMRDANRIRYAYDLFVSVGRDRDYINWNTLEAAMTSIWNVIFASPVITVEAQKRFFEDIILSNADLTRVSEFHIVPKLNAKSRAVLRAMFLEARPCIVKQEDLPRAEEFLHGIEFHVVHVAIHKALELPSLDAILKQHHSNLVQEPEAPPELIPQPIRDLFGKYIQWRNAPKCALISSFSAEDTSRVDLNWPVFFNKYGANGEDYMIHVLACEHLPNLCASTWNIAPLLRRNLPPAPVPAAVADAQEANEDELTDGPAEPTVAVSPFKAPEPRGQKRPVAQMAPAPSPFPTSAEYNGIAYKIVKVAYALIPKDDDDDEDDEEEMNLL